MKKRRKRGFTIVELLVVVSIIALLVGILLPAIGKARDQARLSISRANLRQLAAAHAVYASEWNDRQITMANDNFARYGNTPAAAASSYLAQVGLPHPGIVVGWGAGGAIWGYWFAGQGGSDPANLLPINFNSGWGWFRMPNLKPLNTYVSGKYYDPVFWAPKDRVPMSLLTVCFSQPHEFVDCYDDPQGTTNFIRASYCWSPAALYNQDVLRGDPSAPSQGYQDPMSITAGLRTPGMSQARYSDLKTQLLEHHWLQNLHAECNPNFQPGSFDGCEPFYFNHGRESVPMAAFYDGHVEGLGTMEAQAADSRASSQGGIGLWHRGTPMGTDGYFIPDGWDNFANTSFHILTTDGIAGRDKLGG
ncbi:MAG: type II secretion system protein [Planctomycetota bacterium]|jgi:prepilin-type N-terminal cleavage/methylation domain-containing protein